MTESQPLQSEFFKPAATSDDFVDFGADHASATDVPAVLAQPSNRVTGALVALLAGLVFTLFYSLAVWGYSAAAWLYGDSAEGTLASVFIQERTLAFLSTPVFWLTAIGFTLYFVILAVLINKGHWRSFVLWGLFVAILTYATAIGAGLLTVRAWTLSFNEAIDFMWHGIAFNPLVLVAVVLSREIPIWFGGWIAVKGRKLRDVPGTPEN